MDLAELRREIDWYIQNSFTLSAPVIKRALKDPRACVDALTPAQAARYATLVQGYDLARWPSVCNADDYHLSLYTLDLLDQYLPHETRDSHGLDIGASAWAYLPALLSFTGTPWDGVELDAHRRYWSLSTRRAHADFMRRLCADCRYVSGSLLDVRGTYARITWFLPFVTPAPLYAWGLPRRFFQPLALLRHAWSLLEDGGEMFIVNQGETERAAQARLFSEAGLLGRGLGELHSVFSPFQQPRYGWVLRKSHGRLAD